MESLFNDGGLVNSFLDREWESGADVFFPAGFSQEEPPGPEVKKQDLNWREEKSKLQRKLKKYSKSLQEVESPESRFSILWKMSCLKGQFNLHIQTLINQKLQQLMQRNQIIKDQIQLAQGEKARLLQQIAKLHNRVRAVKYPSVKLYSATKMEQLRNAEKILADKQNEYQVILNENQNFRIKNEALESANHCLANQLGLIRNEAIGSLLPVPDLSHQKEQAPKWSPEEMNECHLQDKALLDQIQSAESPEERLDCLSSLSDLRCKARRMIEVNLKIEVNHAKSEHLLLKARKEKLDKKIQFAKMVIWEFTEKGGQSKSSHLTIVGPDSVAAYRDFRTHQSQLEHGIQEANKIQKDLRELNESLEEESSDLLGRVPAENVNSLKRNQTEKVKVENHPKRVRRSRQ